MKSTELGGTKGQGSRSGSGGKLYRQGGNLPFFRRLPFMRGKGFTPPNQVEYNEVNLDQLDETFKADADVTPESLEAARLLRDAQAGRYPGKRRCKSCSQGSCPSRKCKC